MKQWLTLARVALADPGARAFRQVSDDSARDQLGRAPRRGHRENDHRYDPLRVQPLREDPYEERAAKLEYDRCRDVADARRHEQR